MTVVLPRIHSGPEALHRLMQLQELPDFVKEASEADLWGDEETPAHLYADPERRQLPYHTAAATWLSTALLQEQHHRLSPQAVTAVTDKLDKAAVMHDVRGVCQQVKLAVTGDLQPREDDLPDSAFALVVEWKGGVKHWKERVYPLTCDAEVKLTAEKLAEHYDRFTFADRRTIALRLLKEADSRGLALDNHVALEKQAGMGSTSAAEASRLLDSRRRYLKQQKLDPEVEEELGRLKESFLKDPRMARDNKVLCKLATVVDAVDQIYPAVRKQHGNLEDSLFALTPSQIDNLLDSQFVTKTGSVFNKNDLANLSMDELVSAFGEPVLAHCCSGVHVDPVKTAQFVSDLDPAGARLFEVVASRSGVQPV